MQSLTRKKFFIGLACATAIALLVSGRHFSQSPRHVPPLKRVPLADLKRSGQVHVASSFSPKNPEDARSRHEYEMRRLRDPHTGGIPDNIRVRELAFAAKLPTREGLQKSGAQTSAADWVRRGPINIGGRTRALAIDLNYNSGTNRRILAGGVSGGMFLSEDDGASWRMTTTLAQHASVTALVQDPNNRNVWYYGTGEFFGSARAGTNSIPGQGVFKSTDGGNTWSQLASTVGQSTTQLDNFFDFVWTLAISRQTNTIFAATFGAILRSTDGGSNWVQLLGRNQGPFSVANDVAVAANGAVYAALSRNGGNFQEYGVFRSANNGEQWTDITPNALVADPYRMVLGAAPSEANTLYLLAQANGNGATAPDHQFFRYNAGTNTWTNLSASLPDEQGLSGNSSFSSQAGYDQIVIVKPDNPNVVWVGGTNLYRSTNGGQNFTRVGGYLAPDTYASFENHHSDQHALVFFPNNPNAMLSGNDGGVAKAANALAQQQTWTSLNNGYVATQFYAVALDPQNGSDFIIGGTQDNGSLATEVNDYNTPWSRPLSGDGSYTDIVPGGNPFYVSAQKGFVIRNLAVGNQIIQTLVRPATPNGEGDFLFIAPYQLDPNNPRVMYLAVANGVWRNSNLDAIPPVENYRDPVTINWSALNNSAAPNTQVTTLAIAKTPANRLYFGATDYQSSTVLKRVDNAQNNSSGTTITPGNVPGGSYPSCVGVNPNDGNEILAVFSNYGISSLYHSTNGGGNWSEVEGNLGGTDGPSLRWATIVPTSSGKVYFLATSIGIFSATTLNSTNTVWVQEGATPIGNVVVDMIVARPSDGVVVAGTHGRGVYSTKLTGGGGAAVLNLSVAEVILTLRPGATRSTQFVLSNSGTANLGFNITATDPANSPAPNFIGNLGGWDETLVRRFPRFDRATAQNAPPHATARPARAAPTASSISPPASSSSVDRLILDDGNDAADDFVGFGPNSFNDFIWLNEFMLSGFGFRLESFEFYMRTESAFSNPVNLIVYDANGNALVSGTLNFSVAPGGGWFAVNLNQPVTFNDGSRFSIQVGAGSVIPYPAGADTDAQTPNNSYYYDFDNARYVNLNTIFSNGAFLIRAVGTKLGGANQPPVARAQISTTQARVNESISFDGSGSSDADGQITQYLWNFGDNTSSTGPTTTHAYSQPGAYTFRLTVTDNNGATGQTSGQINITAAQNRLTVSPTNGTVGPNGSQVITVTFNAQGLGEGNYQGRLDITSNGGNRTVPVRITVNNNVAVEEENETPRAFRLTQNYPNPFGAAFSPEKWATTLRYELPGANRVTLAIFDLHGRRIAVLEEGLKAAGTHHATWNGRDQTGRLVASGLYLAELISGRERVRMKMMVAR